MNNNPPAKLYSLPTRKLRIRAAVIATAVMLLAACSEVVPILAQAAMNFGRNLVETASQNAGSRYGNEMEQLIRALAYNALNQAEYKVQKQFPNYGSYAGPAMHTNPQDPYASETFERGVSVVGNVELDVALLAQRKMSDGSIALEPVADGDTLHDGRGDPLAGDKIKIAFKSNCGCYIYIIGIDATGYMAQIYPDPDSPALGNPVQADLQYVMPEGNSWWGLDEYQGVETIYFVASPRQRQDIETALASLSSQSRSVSPRDYLPVREAAVVPLPRGLVKVKEAAPVTITTTSGDQQTIAPTGFLSNFAGADLVITRWFNHQ